MIEVPNGTVVKPNLYPLTAADISSLTSRFEVHPDLIAFWSEHGYGFFSSGHDGTSLSNGSISNRLMDPESCLEIMESPHLEDYIPVMKTGIPFFNKFDMEYLGIDASGEVFDEFCDKRTVIAPSLKEFIDRLGMDPEFYESL